MPIWISDPAELSMHLASLSAQPKPARVALDTEFVRERTYWPQLALVQIAVEGQILLVDPLVPGMAAALAPLLVDANVLKVMHSASEDLVALKHTCGVVPAPLFDTQIAAALAGVGAGIGYQRLVQDTLGVALQKGETRSDWLRRPLSPAQLEYAADDVRHLFALHDHLQARASDRPRSWILDNELATALARTPPPDRPALQAQLDAHPKAPRKLGDALWQALITPLDDEGEAPPVRGDERDKQAMRRLQDAVSRRSAELGLPDGVLASRRWLESLVDSGEWPQALTGWRRGELETELGPLLAAETGTTTAE
ncbi:MAG: ribonuclease D [Luteimonas sp.]